MKRNKAIETIFKRLGPLGISEPTCEDVLRELEKLGMLPPQTVKHVQYKDKFGDWVRIETINEWEND